MSESRDLLVDTADRLFREMAGERGRPFADSWRTLEKSGFLDLLVPEQAGGHGGDLGDAYGVVRAAGAHALALPLGEAMLARSLAGGDTSGFGTVAWTANGEARDGRFTGELVAVPWGRSSQFVIASIESRAVLLSTGDANAIREDQNPADEPRDTLSFVGAPLIRIERDASLPHLGALLRVAQMAGAMGTLLDLSLGYANDRVQFGRSIGKFQTIQHNLAIFAEEVAATLSAGDAAVRAAERGEAGFEIAAAKLRANKAAIIAHATAHAVHGAIGFTREHVLHHYTGRLISWRSEFGSEQHWADWLGGQVIALGGDGLWPELTRRSDAFGAE